MILGAITTFIGVSGLIDAPSECYRVFFIFLTGVLVLGIYHGLVIIPALLVTSDQLTILICRGSAPSSNDDQKKPRGLDKIPNEGEVLVHCPQPSAYLIRSPSSSLPPNCTPLTMTKLSEPFCMMPYPTSQQMSSQLVPSNPARRQLSILNRNGSELRAVSSYETTDLTNRDQVQALKGQSGELQNIRLFLPRPPIHRTLLCCAGIDPCVQHLSTSAHLRSENVRDNEPISEVTAGDESLHEAKETPASSGGKRQ